MKNNLQSIENEILDGEYTQKLFDPVQTHAVYGVTLSRVDKVKEIIKKHGGKRLRMVTANCKAFRIICFKLSK